MEETLLDKGIPEKLTREGKRLAFLYSHQQAETLKHLIAYSNFKMYIYPKSVH
jgi:hypothetical protein